MTNSFAVIISGLVMAACTMAPPPPPVEVSSLASCERIGALRPVLLCVLPAPDSEKAQGVVGEQILLRNVLSEALTSMFGAVVPIRDAQDAIAFEQIRTKADSLPQMACSTLLFVADVRAHRPDWPGQLSMRVYGLFDERQPSSASAARRWHGRPLLYEDFVPVTAELTRPTLVAAVDDLANHLRQDYRLRRLLSLLPSDDAGVRDLLSKEPASRDVACSVFRLTGSFVGASEASSNAEKATESVPLEVQDILFPLRTSQWQEPATISQSRLDEPRQAPPASQRRPQDRP